ncbi:alpha/beta fold hydrolase [Microbacterium gorillae]|uniref:alpha/beta fold hydrolase n=1 Tax=Microbacterium gorillae TaxID=1231063 RepID=UPI0006941C53|nr:alpha/beta hydrolase [Microbacterium gorillae]
MTTPELQRIRFGADGAELPYFRAGSGPDLVFFHGAGLSDRWLPLYDRLAENFTVTVPQSPGFGDSVRPAWMRSVDDLALLQADALAALGVTTFHAVGHSGGAPVAASVAALLPERVLSLTVLAPAPLPLVTPGDGDRLDWANLPEDVDMDHYSFNGNQAAYPEYRDADEDGQNIGPVQDEWSDPEAYDWRGVPSLYRRLARIRGPRQVLIPDDDLLFTPESAEIWAHWLGDAPTVRIVGDAYPTGHLLIVQEPDKIAAAVARLAATA